MKLSSHDGKHFPRNCTRTACKFGAFSVILARTTSVHFTPDPGQYRLNKSFINDSSINCMILCNCETNSHGTSQPLYPTNTGPHNFKCGAWNPPDQQATSIRALRQHAHSLNDAIVVSTTLQTWGHKYDPAVEHLWVLIILLKYTLKII
jgi:hypothetical protein